MYNAQIQNNRFNQNNEAEEHKINDYVNQKELVLLEMSKDYQNGDWEKIATRCLIDNVYHFINDPLVPTYKKVGMDNYLSSLQESLKNLGVDIPAKQSKKSLMDKINESNDTDES